MERATKEQFVATYSERLKSAKIAILADFRGVTVQEINEFRTRVRSSEGNEFRVGKNTLFRRAMDGTDWSALDPFLKGPTAILLGDEDIVEAAKLVTDFAQKNKAFEIKAGFAEGRLMDTRAVEALSKMPGKDQLRAQLLGLMKGVPQKFLALMETPSRSFVSLLENYRKEQAGEES
jgi:large subunit ribosomal protein L10